MRYADQKKIDGVSIGFESIFSRSLLTVPLLLAVSVFLIQREDKIMAGLNIEDLAILMGLVERKMDKLEEDSWEYEELEKLWRRLHTGFIARQVDQELVTFGKVNALSK